MGFCNGNAKFWTCLKTCLWNSGTYRHKIVRLISAQFDCNEFVHWPWLKNEINDPSNCKAGTKKRIPKKKLFDWKIQFEKVQLTRDLKDDTIIYQGSRLPCKNDPAYCEPTTRSQATIVWFPEVTCTTFQEAKTHARMIKFHKKCIIESILYENVSPEKIKHSNYKFRNIINIENKLTRFKI